MWRPESNRTFPLARDGTTQAPTLHGLGVSSSAAALPPWSRVPPAVTRSVYRPAWQGADRPPGVAFGSPRYRALMARWCLVGRAGLEPATSDSPAYASAGSTPLLYAAELPPQAPSPRPSLGWRDLLARPDLPARAPSWAHRRYPLQFRLLSPRRCALPVGRPVAFRPYGFLSGYPSAHAGLGALCPPISVRPARGSP